MSTFQLPYLKVDVTSDVTPYGFEVVKGGDLYKDIRIRNRVVYRVDIISSMTKFFSKDILVGFRDIVFCLVSGSIKDPSRISEIFETLYKQDDTFKHYLATAYYFDNRAYTTSLYIIFIKDFIEEYKKKVQMFKDKALIWDYKYLFEDRGFIYLAGRDENVTYVIPEGYQEEVLSVGKIWSGSIKRIQCEV